MKGILVVRKYKNRRLYDTEQSKHITREELLEIVRAGRNVQVQEAKTGEDVTVETLLHVLLAEASPSMNATIPPEFIHFLIRANQNNLTQFFRDFMPGAMQAFQATFRNLRDQGKRMTEQMFPYGSYGAAWNYPFSQPAPAATRPAAAGDEVADLRTRLKDLEGELKKLRKRR